MAVGRSIRSAIIRIKVGPPYEGGTRSRVKLDKGGGCIKLNYMKPIPYNPNLKKLAKEMRNSSTLSEVLLWKCIQKKKVKGYTFLRQKPLLNYIVDFYCPELNLAIEIDGSVHEYTELEDQKRQKELEQYGVHFIRFLDNHIRKNPDGAVLIIEKWIKKCIEE